MKKGKLHPRNPHQGRYDFVKLVADHPALQSYVAKNQYGDLTIDFVNPMAVRELNRALLKKHYKIEFWDIPASYLCPPIPGRADYIHHLADLLATTNGGAIPTGSQVRILDIGVGANCVYPLIGHHDYGWNFVGSDVNPESIKNAKEIIDRNSGISSAVEFRLQTDAKTIFKGVIGPTDHFAATLCNPPFHSSLAEAQAGSARKWKNLGKGHQKQNVNFGGQGAELWCDGGEVRFIETMIRESADFAAQVRWYSVLVSKSESLPKIEADLKKVGATKVAILPMEQGQKKSRVVAWRF